MGACPAEQPDFDYGGDAVMWDVTATSDGAVAVGTYSATYGGDAFAEAFDGEAWRLQPLRTPQVSSTRLAGISRPVRPTYGLSVGPGTTARRRFAQHWDGSRLAGRRRPGTGDRIIAGECGGENPFRRLGCGVAVGWPWKIAPHRALERVTVVRGGGSVVGPDRGHRHLVHHRRRGRRCMDDRPGLVPRRSSRTGPAALGRHPLDQGGPPQGASGSVLPGPEPSSGQRARPMSGR